MGTWGPGAFENDAALDWLIELASAENTWPLEAALQAVVDQEEYLDSRLCQPALAAAEVVASMAGSPADRLHEVVFDYVQRMQRRPDQRLVKLALDALSRIKSDSELKELHPDTEWLKTVHVLERRLSA